MAVNDRIVHRVNTTGLTRAAYSRQWVVYVGTVAVDIDRTLRCFADHIALLQKNDVL